MGGGIKVTWCVCRCNPLLHPRTVWPPSPPAAVTPERRRKGEWWFVWVAVHVHVLIRRSHVFCTQKSGVAALPALSYCKWSNMEDGVSVWVKINRCAHVNASYRCRERKRSEYSSTVWGVASLGRLRWQTGTPLTPVISPAACCLIYSQLYSQLPWKQDDRVYTFWENVHLLVEEDGAASGTMK